MGLLHYLLLLLLLLRLDLRDTIDEGATRRTARAAAGASKVSSGQVHCGRQLGSAPERSQIHSATLHTLDQLIRDADN